MSHYNTAAYYADAPFRLRDLVLDFVPDSLVKLARTAPVLSRDERERIGTSSKYETQFRKTPFIDIDAIVADYREQPEVSFGVLVGRTPYVSLAERKAAERKRILGKSFSFAYYSRHR